jgi:hypothetical protein
MDFADIVIAAVMAGIIGYSGWNIVRGLRAGRIGFPGGTVHDRARRPSDFWTTVGFEAAMILVCGFILSRQLG